MNDALSACERFGLELACFLDGHLLLCTQMHREREMYAVYIYIYIRIYIYMYVHIHAYKCTYSWVVHAIFVIVLPDLSAVF